jgi:hypothetical protein
MSIGGIQAGWTISSRRASLITATSAACVEHLVATGGAVDRIAADGGLLAYATAGGNLGLVTGQRNPHARLLAAYHDRLAGLSADNREIAALRRDGIVELWSRHGDLAGTIAVGNVRAIALRGSNLLALNMDDTLSVFDAASGRLESSWPLPHGVRAEVDAHYGYAVLSRAREIFALNLSTGRTVRLATAPRPARAQIEAPGVAYGFNLNGVGHLRFVPLSQVQRVLH